jgi:hypothetical protein
MNKTRYKVRHIRCKMSSGYFKSFEELYKEYPMLRTRSAEIEEIFY